jgi:hypothetical protein
VNIIFQSSQHVQINTTVVTFHPVNASSAIKFIPKGAQFSQHDDVQTEIDKYLQNMSFKFKYKYNANISVSSLLHFMLSS